MSIYYQLKLRDLFLLETLTLVPVELLQYKRDIYYHQLDVVHRGIRLKLVWKIYVKSIIFDIPVTVQVPHSPFLQSVGTFSPNFKQA
jgi:hypothetical protein